MCSLFAHQPEADYECQTRSLRIGGHGTSIRLEAAFWAVLEELAESEGSSLAKFLTVLYGEVLAHHGDVRNFSSLLRCACLVHLSRAAGRDVGAGFVRPPLLVAAE